MREIFQDKHSLHLWYVNIINFEWCHHSNYINAVSPVQTKIFPKHGINFLFCYIILIISFHSMSFSYETGNGIKFEESGYQKDNASEKIQVIQGSVSYTDKEGNVINLKWVFSISYVLFSDFMNYSLHEFDLNYWSTRAIFSDILLTKMAINQRGTTYLLHLQFLKELQSPWRNWPQTP